MLNTPWCMQTKFKKSDYVYSFGNYNRVSCFQDGAMAAGIFHFRKWRALDLIYVLTFSTTQRTEFPDSVSTFSEVKPIFEFQEGSCHYLECSH
jgi:hypothetical protein